MDINTPPLKMDFRTSEDSGESLNRAEDSKGESEKPFFSSRNEQDDAEFKTNQPKDGAVAPKPSDVRNGDLVSLLLAATPPYLYNIPLVPQTFFFSEMLKSFVQAKTERQNLKAQQSHHRRQRKRSWREVTPPKPMPYEGRDKPLELTTPKQSDEKTKTDKPPGKKFQPDDGDKKLGNFSVEKLANSSINSGSDANSVNVSGDMLPPAPPLWYPLLYPPHPPYGIDPLHFFIDLRVSAHFWDRTKLNENVPAVNPHADASLADSPLRTGHVSAFRVPSPRKVASQEIKRRGKGRNVHYVISSLKDIYESLRKENKEEEEEEEEEDEEKEGVKGEEGEEGEEEKKCKDLRALIGLELVVDYVKQESDVEEDKSDADGPEQEQEFQTVCIDTRTAEAVSLTN